MPRWEQGGYFFFFFCNGVPCLHGSFTSKPQERMGTKKVVNEVAEGRCGRAVGGCVGCLPGLLGAGWAARGGVVCVVGGQKRPGKQEVQDGEILPPAQVWVCRAACTELYCTVRTDCGTHLGNTRPPSICHLARTQPTSPPHLAYLRLADLGCLGAMRNAVVPT